MFIYVKGKRMLLEKNDWQLEIKYRKRKGTMFSTRILWWMIPAQEKLQCQIIVLCEVRYGVNLRLG